MDGVAYRGSAKRLDKAQFRIECDRARKIARVEIYHWGAEADIAVPQMSSTAQQANRPCFSLCALWGLGFSFGVCGSRGAASIFFKTLRGGVRFHRRYRCLLTGRLNSRLVTKNRTNIDLRRRNTTCAQDTASPGEDAFRAAGFCNWEQGSLGWTFAGKVYHPLFGCRHVQCHHGNRRPRRDRPAQPA
jgi:hypothetical protein